MGTGKFNAGSNPTMDYKHAIQEGSRNTPRCFMLQKPEKIAGLMYCLASMQTLANILILILIVIIIIILIIIIIIIIIY